MTADTRAERTARHRRPAFLLLVAAITVGGAAALVGGVRAASAQNPEPALTGYKINEGPEISVPRQDGLAIGNAPCPRGKRALGGGFASDASTVQAYISAPNFSGTAWVFAFKNTEPTAGPAATVRPFVTCASTG